jgi:hypothetical protein
MEAIGCNSTENKFHWKSERRLFLLCHILGSAEEAQHPKKENFKGQAPRGTASD